MIGGLILAEVLQGFRNDRDFRRAREALDTLIFRHLGGAGHDASVAAGAPRT